MRIATSCWSPRRGWSAPLPDWDDTSTLVMVLGGSMASSASVVAPALGDVVRRFPHSVVVGCSTAGSFVGTSMVDDGLTVSVVRFDHSTVRTVSEQVSEPTSGSVGVELGRRLREAAPDLAAVFVLSDGLQVNGTTLAAGLARGVSGPGRDVPVTGGLAGDGTRFTSTWVVDGGSPVSGRAVAVGLYGSSLDIGYSSVGGWSVLGPERTVTRSRGTTLLEVDGRPALDMYKLYLGERARGLPATALLFPLALRTGPGADALLVRTVLGVDEASHSMTFAGDVPEGAVVQLMRGSSDRLIEAALDAGTAARAMAAGGSSADLTQGEAPEPAPPALALAVSCVGRRLFLGQRVEDELDAVATGLGPDCTLVGFYSYGELSPLTSGGCDLHNQTMTVTVVRERAS